MKKESALNFIELSVKWLAICFPFLIAAGKGAADAGVVTLAAFFVIYSITAKDFRFLKEKWVIAAGTLWVYLILRGLFSPDIKHALVKVLPFVRFILFAVCLEFLASKDSKTSSKMFVTTCIVLAFLTVDGFIQFFTGFDLFGKPKYGIRLTGPFSKQILGTTIASIGIIVMAGLIPLLKKSKNYLWFILSAGVLTYIIVFLAGERAAFLRLNISIVLLFLGLYLKTKNAQIKKNIWKTAVLTVLLCLVVVQVISFLKPENVHRQLASSIQEATSSQSSYIFLWKTGLKAGFSNIFFGIGPNQFEFFCKANAIPGLGCATLDNIYYHPHNIWIEIFAESGLVGVGLLGALIYALGQRLVKFCTTCSNIFECSLAIGVGLAAFQRLLPLPSSGFFKNWYAVPIWFAIGWMLCICATHMNKASRNKV